MVTANQKLPADKFSTFSQFVSLSLATFSLPSIINSRVAGSRKLLGKFSISKAPRHSAACPRLECGSVGRSIADV
jgi:hypothetical protein